MSDFSNKNVHFFAPYLHIFALISRVDFSQPKYVGRLKSTLLANMIVLGRNNSNPYGCVVFEEKFPKNNGLIFMEPYNVLKDDREDQFEFLGQRGDNHVVIDAKFDGNKKILFVQTVLEHNTPEILYPVNFPNIDKNTSTKEEVIKAINNKEYNFAWK